MPGPTPTPPQTFLQVLSSCDNYRVGSAGDEQVIPWLLCPDSSSPAIGLLRPEIVAQLRKENASSSAPSWEISDDPDRGYVSFARGIDTPAARSRVMKELCERWRDTGLWPEEISPRKWRAELYPVYRNPFGPRDYPKGGNTDGDALNYAFEMERAASGLFGIVTYGVHMTIFEEVPGDGPEAQYKIWVPRRAATKQTWPGYLDNSVAGGIDAGRGVFDCAVKESMEEASIPEDVVRRYAHATGSISYFFRSVVGAP